MKMHLTLCRDDYPVLLMDGVDIAPNVAPDGFTLDLRDPHVPLVTITFVPESLVVDGDVIASMQWSDEPEVTA